MYFAMTTIFLRKYLRNIVIVKVEIFLRQMRIPWEITIPPPLPRGRTVYRPRRPTNRATPFSSRGRTGPPSARGENSLTVVIFLRHMRTSPSRNFFANTVCSLTRQFGDSFPPPPPPLTDEQTPDERGGGMTGFSTTLRSSRALQGGTFPATTRMQKKVKITDEPGRLDVDDPGRLDVDDPGRPDVDDPGRLVAFFYRRALKGRAGTTGRRRAGSTKRNYTHRRHISKILKH